MSGYAVPAGGLPWHEAQLAFDNGEPAAWQAAHKGAAANGELPDTAWHTPQLAGKPVPVTPVWVDPVNRTAWFGPPGPPEWQAAPLNVEEKQLGALLSVPVPGPSTLWQMAQDTPRSPAFRCDAA